MSRWALVGTAALAVACGASSSGTGRDGDGTGSGGGAGAGSGGGAGASKGGGAGAGNPTNYFIGEIRQSGRDKLDLLVMVDNSLSMAEKQRYLAETIPVLLSRLVTPVCVDWSGQVSGGTSPCGPGSVPEFRPLEDIHLGVITSSLGDHGSGDLCAESMALEDETPDDRAELIPSTRTGLPSWNGAGFLVWDPRDGGAEPPHDPPGYGSPLAGNPGTLSDLTSAFMSHVTAAGDGGCGHEAQLESWYRFLVDPEPVTSMTNEGGFSVRGPVNQVLLEQRDSFLRRDSLLAIVMLTDENDCSFLDEEGTQGWLAMYTGGSSNSWRMPRATSACADPNSVGCAPCSAASADPACAAGQNLTAEEDHPNLRCYRMKERFGIDLKYPVKRYVDALTSTTIDPRSTGQLVQNPIFAPGANGEARRDTTDVIVLGIVGVPWQDIATDGSVAGKVNSLLDSRDIQYMTAAELEENGRWDLILGDGDGSEPGDPFMVESVDPRPAGTPHPFLPGVTITEPGGSINAVNGTEQAVPPGQRFDLQFACTFPLESPVPCTMQNARACACNAQEAAQQSPLCEYDMPNSDGIQVRDKAYPSIRELELLRELRSSAVVASVCPKNVIPEGGGPELDPNYGYNPAVSALVELIKESVATRCLPRSLIATEGRVACSVIEVALPSGGPCAACGVTPGRLEITSEGLDAAIHEQMSNLSICGPGASLPCDEFCACELQQFQGDELYDCQNESDVSSDVPGFCYLDEENAAPELLAACPVGSKRILRFLGPATPKPSSYLFIACVGRSSVSPSHAPAR
jgi:hypothetical protein